MNRLIDFSSRFRILKGGKISLVVSAFLGSTIIANAAPNGGVVTSGNATISQSGNVTNINQSSGKASINWNDFSVKANEIVNFNQPNVNSITLNRVVGNEKSVIDGALNANGQVWILNSNGILFGKNASINTAGLLATTGELSDADFQNGNYDFKNSSSNSVINLGTIKVNNSSYVILAGKEVQNGGNIEAVKGKVHLVGADSYSVNLNGNSLVNLKVNKGVLDAMVSNSGNILANGGEIFLTTNAVNELLKGVVNNTGVLEANSIDGLTGKVEVYAHGGTTNVSGTIEAKDGFVETSGKKVNIDKDTKVTAKTWLIDPTNIVVNNSTAYETALNNGTDTIIQTDNSTGTDEGNIYINDTIDWNTSAKLTLDAYNNIYINNDITATNGKLALYYGQGAVNSGNTSDYYIDDAKVNLSSGNNFFTKLGSNGSEVTWTVVNTPSELQAISLSGKYVLGNDIDLNNVSWTKIGRSNSSFRGSIDGLGHTISNLTYNYTVTTGEYFFGLFGYSSGGLFQNLNLDNFYITAENTNSSAASETGTLAGSANNTTIKNVYVTKSTVSTSRTSGGLVGSLSNGSKIIDSAFEGGTVNGKPLAGGLVGNMRGSIENSFANANVSALGSAGGLVGSMIILSNSTGTIKNSYAKGSVTGGNAGGIAGRISSDGTNIINSYASNSVSGTTSAGGIIGYLNNYSASITQSYYDNEINQGTMADSLLGKTKAEILALVSNGTWDNTIWVAGASDFSGYAVNMSFTLPELQAFYTAETLFESGYGTQENPYIITNWTQLQNINNSNILTQSYYFKLLNDLNSTTSDYTDLASSTANSGAGWNPLGNSTNKFTGTFDGDNHTIGYLYISREDESNLGLFGYTNNATIKNLGLENVYMIVGKNNVGTLVGNAQNTTISNVYATAYIDEANNFKGLVYGDYGLGGLVGYLHDGSKISNSYASIDVLAKDGTPFGYGIGGLVGSLNNTSKISNSYATGNVTGTSHSIGGLVGVSMNDSIVENSYTRGDVIGKSSVGGIVGYQSGGSIINTYAVGKIEHTGTNSYDTSGAILGYRDDVTLSNNFYDEETTGQTIGIGGAVSQTGTEGKTTKQMQTFATFDDAQWNVELDATLKKIYPYLTFDENGNATWKIGKYSTGLNYILGTANTTYDGTNQSLTNFWTNAIFGDDGSSLVAGIDYKFVYDSENATVFKNAGTYNNISVVILNEDYELDETGTNTLGKFVIAKKDATVTANSDTKTYNGLTQNVSGFTATGLVNGETESVLTGISGATASGKNAGEYVTTLSGTDGNYNLTFVDGKLTISKANAIVTANSSEVTYNGQTQNVNGFTASGLVNGETESVLTGITGATASGKNAGEYVTTLSGTDGNYNLTFVDGKLTISKANATVTANSNTVTYNGQTQNVNGFTASGLVNGETESVLTGITGATASGKNAGEYVTTLSGTDGNYNLTFVDGKLTISKANATVTANSNTVTYNGQTQNVNGFTASGLVNGETESVLTGITGATASGKNAGEYVTTLSGTDGNYNLTFVDGKLTISKANATVTANSNTVAYNGQTQNVNGFTASGLVNGETESVLTGITGATASGKNAGEYVTTLSGTDGNYNLTFVDGKLVIEKAKDNLSNVLTPIANTTVTTPKVNVVIPPQVPFTQTPTFLNNGTPVNLVSAPIQNQPITMVSMGELRLNQDSNILSASNDIRVPVGDNSKIELVNGGVNLPNGVEQQFFVVGNEEN